MHKRFVVLSAAVLAAGLIPASAAQAALGVDSASYTYSQDFDALAASGTANTWANDSTLAGWSLFSKDAAAISTYRADNGGSNTGSFYSYGTTGSGDRARSEEHTSELQSH